MSTRNSGKTKQDAILNQFARDARSTVDNSASAQAIAEGKRRQAERLANPRPEPIRMSYRNI
jgi:hypothetical protein